MDPKQLEEMFWKLPEEIQEAITSVETATKLQQIGKINGLHLDDLDIIFEEVGKVMMGLSKPENFGMSIRGRLGLPDEKTRMVVRSIDDEIFQPIRKSLAGIISTREEVGEEASPAEQAAPPANTLQKPATSASVIPIPIPPRSAPKPPLEPEISRDQILKEIENPETISPPPKEPVSSPVASSRLAPEAQKNPASPFSPPPSPPAPEPQSTGRYEGPVVRPISHTASLSPSAGIPAPTATPTSALPSSGSRYEPNIPRPSFTPTAPTGPSIPNSGVPPLAPPPARTPKIVAASETKLSYPTSAPKIAVTVTAEDIARAPEAPKPKYQSKDPYREAF